jgi:hypothetical protein
MLKGVALAAALTVWAGSALAATNLIPGKITVVKPGKLAKMVAKPISPALFPLPASVTTGTVQFFDTGTAGNEDTYAASAGTWTGLGNPAGSKGWKYKGTKTAGDPCVVVLIKEKVIKAVCKGADVTVDGIVAGDLGIIITTDADTYCASFGGTTVKNQPGLVKRKNAPAPLSCPAPAVATTTSTSTSTTTSSTVATCCGAERITLKSSVGSLQVDNLPTFTFPANVTTIMDTSAPVVGLPECKHNVIVPAGGFTVPNYDIALLNFCSSVTVLGCESGSGEGKGSLWDGGGSTPALTGVQKDADTSDGVCDASYTGPGTCLFSGGSCVQDPNCPTNACVAGTCTLSGGVCSIIVACPQNSCSSNCDFGPGGVGANTLGKIQTTRSAGGTSGVRSVLDIPVHSLTWSDSLCSPQTNPGCCTGSNYNPADGDVLSTEFDFILSPTTGNATGAFTDLNGDACKRAGSGFDTAAPGADGPKTLNGSPAAGPCCTVGQASTVVSVGIGFAGAGPLYDLGFKSTIPNTVASCGAPAAGDCTITTDPCLGSPSGAFID